MKQRLFFTFTLCLFTFTSCPLHAETAKHDSAYVERLFLEARYEKVVSESSALIDSSSGRRDQLYYLKGLSELKLNRFGDARRTLETLLAKYHRSKLAFDSYVGIGDAYLLEGNAGAAISIYEDILKRYPNDKNAGTVYHRIGSCYEKLGSGDKARSYFDKARTASPLSFEARQNVTNIAPRKMAENIVQAVISVQTGSFKNKRNAEKMSRKLSGQGYESYITLPQGRGDNLYRVRVGRLSSREDANLLASRLRSSGYSTKIFNGDVCQ